MKIVLRRFLTISLCLFAFSTFLFSQTADTTFDNNSQTSIERSFSIPATTETGYDAESSSASSSGWLLVRMILALAAICIIIWLIGKLIKKRMEPGAEPDSYLKKTAQLTLAPGRTVQIITLRDRAYVLGVSEGGISLIDEIDSTSTTDKELIDDMNLHAAENLNAKPQDFAAMLSSLTNSSKRTEDFIKTRRMNFKKNGERK